MSEVFLRAEVTRPNREAQETLLAEPLGNDLYELKSIPKIIPALNYGDIVKAFGNPPTIDGVVSSSGHQTFRIVFLQGTSEKVHQEVAHSMRQWRATAELVCKGFYAVSVAPEGDLEAIRAYLAQLKQRRLLLYEPETPLENLMQIVAQNITA